MENRRALLDAAKSLVAAKGVRATTTAEIAIKAGVAKGLLFYYFKDKESTIRAIAEELDAAYMASLLAKVEHKPALERLHALINHHFNFLKNSPEDAQFLYQSMVVKQLPLGFYEHLYTHILDILVLGLRSGEFVLQDPEELAYMILGSLHGIGRLMLSEFKRDYDAAKHLAMFYDHVLLCQA
ncbi:MAG: TetR/AcrR family transcriptional regulator [Deltaproteobacteria bacterium HGW-Deltaproteobacteria-8]|jgi:AcrR family transcriptional regulator|nr:MAG: TetR/AcrR family transcriptional regulator [Deltaproteobacteria bacterium HGW-Deltaproteobacteria-8]